MTLALLLGAVAGLAGVLAWRLSFPPTPPLQVTVDRIRRRDEVLGASADDDDLVDALARSVGTPVLTALRGLGLRPDALAADLRLLGRSLERHMADKVVFAALGAVLPGVVALVWGASGHLPSPSLPLVGGVVLGVAFFFLPDANVRAESERRRRGFRQALGSFLDLVVISLAGGAGVESALRDAARIGDGWAFGRLRRALEAAAFTGETPWTALARLGEDIGVPELAELSASVSLAGVEGARVRDSLAAKATSLRDHALAEAEAEAQSGTERMAIPTVLLFFGFLVLIGFPALDAVLFGL